MTRIAFYVSRQQSLQARLKLACRLIDKAFERSLCTYVQLENQEQCVQLNELIWTFSDTSFIPHAMASKPDSRVSVYLMHDYEPMERCDFLINLTPVVPDFFARFARMSEVIDREAQNLQAGRERYRFYRDRGYALDYHEL